jgi:peroxiredoxin Q/BCP
MISFERSISNVFISLFLSLIIIACAGEDMKIVELNIGDKVPEFSATDDQGNAWNSKDIVGKKMLVVYFYPAAMTGG